MADALSRLVADTTQLRHCWETEPLVSRQLGTFDDVFSLDAMGRLLVDSGVVASTVRLMHHGEELDRALFSTTRELALPTNEARVDGAEVLRRVAAGTTVALEELQWHSPTVRDFTTAVTAETGYHTYTTAFLTPAHSFGAPPHYDRTSVFVRQVHGSKRWRIGAPLEKWPRDGRCLGPDEPFDLVLDVVLEEGDCLYLPRGYVHAPETGDEVSLHITIGVLPVTWQTVLLKLLSGSQPAALQEALPFGFHALSDDDLRRELVQRLDLTVDFLRLLDRPAVSNLLRRRFGPLSEPRSTDGADLLRAALHHARTRSDEGA
jgi:ribosomal protein L16 Arg81 hydroxylase